MAGNIAPPITKSRRVNASAEQEPGIGRPDAHDCALAGYGIFVDLAAFEHEVRFLRMYSRSPTASLPGQVSTYVQHRVMPSIIPW